MSEKLISTISTALCLLGMIGLLLLTSPIANIEQVFIFFLLTVLFLYSATDLAALAMFRSDKMSFVAKQRILLIAIVITTFIMLHTTGAINAIDAGVLLLVAVSWLAYSEYRFSKRN